MKKIEEKMDKLNILRKNAINIKLKQNLTEDLNLIESFPDKVF